jgi:hypothetical protein
VTATVAEDGFAVDSKIIAGCKLRIKLLRVLGKPQMERWGFQRLPFHLTSPFRGFYLVRRKHRNDYSADLKERQVRTDIIVFKKPQI